MKHSKRGAASRTAKTQPEIIETKEGYAISGRLARRVRTGAKKLNISDNSMFNALLVLGLALRFSKEADMAKDARHWITSVFWHGFRSGLEAAARR